MDVWQVAQSSRSGLDRGFLMDVGPTRARIDPDTSEQGDGEERTAVEIMNQDLVVAASL